MSKVRFQLNRQGVRELMRSQEMMDVCKKYGNNALARLGDGYAMDEHVGQNRVNVSLRTKSREAVKENLENNTLLKAIRGG